MWLAFLMRVRMGTGDAGDGLGGIAEAEEVASGEKTLWLERLPAMPSEEQSKSRCGSPRSRKKSHDRKNRQRRIRKA